MRDRARLLLTVLVSCTALTVLAGRAFQQKGLQAESAEHLSRGWYWLHNFEYDRAESEFLLSFDGDPGFQAVRGVVLSRFRFLWASEDTLTAREHLSLLGLDSDSRIKAVRNDTERLQLAALETLTSAERTRDERYSSYLKAAAALAARQPDDVGAQLDLALAIMAVGTTAEYVDEAAYDRAGEILKPLVATHPRNAGVLHYFVHAMDRPGEYDRAVQSARDYAELAGDSPHAQHMAGHLLVRAGLWAEATKALHRSAVLEARVSADPELTSSPPPAPGQDDEPPLTSTGLHTALWLEYAALQGGMKDEALAILQRAVKSSDHAAGGESQIIAGRMWALFAVEVGAAPPGLELWSPNSIGAELIYAKARLALSAGDVSTAKSAVTLIEDRRSSALAGRPPTVGWPDPGKVGLESCGGFGDSAEVLVLLLRGEIEEAAGRSGIAQFRQAAAIETRLNCVTGPPYGGVIAGERYADALLASGKASDAVAEYRRVLAVRPGRAHSLAGEARALSTPAS